MERLPGYISRLNMGSSVYFFNESDICIHKKQNHFSIIKCTTGEIKKLDLKNAYKFMVCNKAKKLFFVRGTHGKSYYFKPDEPFDNSKTKSYLHFYVYDLSSGTYKKSKPFRQLTPSDNMSAFHSDDENIIAICNNGDILTINTDTLFVELTMRLSDFAEMGDKFVYGPWYRTGRNKYETIVRRQRYWYKSNSHFDNFADSVEYLYVKLDLLTQALDCIPGDGKMYETSVYLEDCGLWVHQRSNNSNRLKVSASVYDIKKNNEIIWSFEIPHKASDVMHSGWECRSIFDFSENLFVICFNKMIYLCNLHDMSHKSIFFNTGMYDVFYNKEKGHILPIYYLGTTEEMITLDDFR